MDTNEFLAELSRRVRTGELTKDEVLKRIDVQETSGVEDNTLLSTLSQLSITKILYILGAAIVIVGIFIFIAQIWEDITSVARILLTLGLGLLVTALGSLLLKQKPQEHIGSIFHFIGGALVPGGTLVTLHELNTGVVSTWPIAISFGIIFAFYLLLNIVHKTPVLTFFSIVNGTAFLYLLIGAIVEGSAYQHDDIYAYLTMVVGASYYFLAHTFKENWNKHLIWLLYFFAILGFLGAAFSQVFDSVPWQMVFFLLVIGGLFLSIYTKSKSILVVSTFFLIAHITFITSEYFADSLGWPISLVILGLAFIGLGYTSITINKRYIQKN